MADMDRRERAFAHRIIARLAQEDASHAQAEAGYDALAEAIDRAPAGRSELMLVKLALLLAQELGDGARVAELIEVALRDLRAGPSP